MDSGPTPMDPAVVADRFAARLEEAGLPPIASAAHVAELDMLEVSWAHGVTLLSGSLHRRHRRADR